jgi:hypothetical protein
MKRIHTISVVALLAYIALVVFNVPPLVESDHISVNCNLLSISGIGLLLAVVYVAVVIVLRKRRLLKGMDAPILLVEAVVLMGMSLTLLFKALRFFGMV